ncbi:MAG TPA: TetR/AcrR family transcriptional regulator [Aquihabitans sp.]|nr:TetR/AcrR family transcriptional regulator [Aquihabitans sp.]
MAERTNDTRERLVATTADLLREHGYAGTGLKAIVAAGEATIGSLYHHFPGGKEDLAEAALRTSGAGYQLLVEAIIDDAPDVATGIRQSFPAAAQVLEASGYADACPIATVALEVASTNERLRRATGEIFEGWLEALASRLRAAGLGERAARDAALVYLSALEGAFVVCRATRSTEAMAAAGAWVADAVDAALAEAR